MFGRIEIAELGSQKQNKRRLGQANQYEVLRQHAITFKNKVECMGIVSTTVFSFICMFSIQQLILGSKKENGI